MNVLVLLYSYYKYNNSQTKIYNGTIIFKFQQLPISSEFIMLLQIKRNTRKLTFNLLVYKGKMLHLFTMIVIII